MRKSLGLALSAAMTFAFVGPVVVAQADAVGPTTFESFSTNSVDGQSGWSSTGPFDQGVVATNRYPSFGGQALRISNSTVSGSFADQPMSNGLANPAGESLTENHFDSTFQIGSMSDTEQPGLKMSVSPDDGNGSRMSYLRFEDTPDGVNVIFAEAKDAGPMATVADFPETTVATNLDRKIAHTIRFSIDFVAGESNDVAKIYIDGVLKHTGTTWENYFRFDPQQKPGGNVVPTVSKLLFRLGGGPIQGAPGTKDAGFLIDNVALTSSTSVTPIPELGTTFEDFFTGSVNGQHGWSSTGGFDQAVAATNRFPANFNEQSLRISNAVTSGAFGNQTFSSTIANPAGESTSQRNFNASFLIGTMQDAEQPGLSLSVSPDNGTGGRMSYLRFEDQGDGVHVHFADVQGMDPLPPTKANFTDTDIATLDRTRPHKIRFLIDFLRGPGNDVVTIRIDGVLKHTGTSWEDYYRYDPEAAAGGNKVLPVSTLLFKAGGTAAPLNAGKGFLFDNVTIASSAGTADPVPPTTPPVVLGAPTIGTATAANQSAVVKWTKPASDGGSAITGYDVWVADATTGAQVGELRHAASGASNLTVTGLVNGTTYTFKVKAINALATGAYSAVSNTVTPIPAVSRMSDFNKDGFTDIVSRDAAGKLWLYPGNTAGSFKPRHQMGYGWNAMTMVTPGDVTGDGNADVFAKDSAGTLWLYPGTGASSFGAKRKVSAGWGSLTIINAADLNGNGRPDLLARDSAGGLWLYPLRGNGVFGTRTKVGTGWTKYTILGPGDASGDGRADILARDSAGVLWLYRGNGAGGVLARTRVASGWLAMIRMVTPGNWDRDDGNDVLATDTLGRLWLYAGDYAAGQSARRQIGRGWNSMSYIG